jgi:hypothetical protein
VGTLNRTGIPYRGSYDIWTRNQLSALLDETTDIFQPRSQFSEMHGWVNGNDYEHSGESFRILPLSEATRVKFGMLAYHLDFARDKKI